jgi:hypothetical protein
MMVSAPLWAQDQPNADCKTLLVSVGDAILNPEPETDLSYSETFSYCIGNNAQGEPLCLSRARKPQT